MASNPPGKCCAEDNFHEGTPVGTHKELFGLPTYVVGDSTSRIIVRYQVDLFSGVAHGFAVRGDIKDPVVRYAKEKALSDQLCFFDSVQALKSYL
ncbi:hypothetical protein Cantr_07251 [Candida viswanathii]|uniref:Dienelactone hydrolase domain-containing protein n=1 Tax=Candida viswanathii TaxID=5486 RepID=A0A367XZ95_9ASCO|nr:hypothetical protein Cantr_07251 [Candida viswanathii]